MRYFRYSVVLLLIGVIQLLFGSDVEYMPEILFLVAIASSFRLPRNAALFGFFIAGLIYDLFLGRNLGVNAFAFTCCGILVNAYRINIHSQSNALRMLLLAFLLSGVFAFRIVFDNYSILNGHNSVIFINKLVFSILIAPMIGITLELPIIRPWKNMIRKKGIVKE